MRKGQISRLGTDGGNVPRRKLRYLRFHVREDRISRLGTAGGKVRRRKTRSPCAFAVILVALSAFAAAGSSAAGPLATTTLTVTYRKDATSSPTTWMLRCNPARGTLPRPGVACRRLAVGGAKLFAPAPRNVACTQVYGGPQTALVTGLVAGRRVWARFSRVDGCQIARWIRLSPWLLPPGGMS